MSGPWLARRYAAAQRGETPMLETVTTLGGQQIAALAAVRAIRWRCA
jgi:hypothetical protein